jgi:hypothetical protein
MFLLNRQAQSRHDRSVWFQSILENTSVKIVALHIFDQLRVERM